MLLLLLRSGGGGLLLLASSLSLSLLDVLVGSGRLGDRGELLGRSDGRGELLGSLDNLLLLDDLLDLGDGSALDGSDGTPRRYGSRLLLLLGLSEGDSRALLRRGGSGRSNGAHRRRALAEVEVVETGGEEGGPLLLGLLRLLGLLSMLELRSGAPVVGGELGGVVKLLLLGLLGLLGLLLLLGELTKDVDGVLCLSVLLVRRVEGLLSLLLLVLSELRLLLAVGSSDVVEEVGGVALIVPRGGGSGGKGSAPRINSLRASLPRLLAAEAELLLLLLTVESSSSGSGSSAERLVEGSESPLRLGSSVNAGGGELVERSGGT